MRKKVFKVRIRITKSARASLIRRTHKTHVKEARRG